MRQLPNIGLIALGVAAGVLILPVDSNSAPIKLIALWAAIACLIAGVYGVFRTRQRRAAVESLSDEQKLFRQLADGCPACGKQAGFYNGPEGGANVNLYCANAECRQGYNVAPPIGWAQKIGRKPPFQYPEDFRDVKMNGEPKDKPKPAQTVTLSRKQITRTNTARRMAGKPRLSAEGLKAAIVAAPAPSGHNANDWLLYLMMWNAVDSAHISQHDDIGTGVKIDHVTSGGGEFGGAGATASWVDNTDTDAKSAWETAAAATASAAAASLIASSSPSSSSDSPSSYSSVSDSSAPAPESTPAPSAPEPSPSYSSSSSDSYSSSSFDSGSSSGADGGGSF